MFSLIAQIGEQVDFLRFLPAREHAGQARLVGRLSRRRPGWIIPGMLKLLAGSFLAFLAVEHFVPLPKAVEPTRMYLVAFGYVFSSPQMALAFTGAFVVISQLKINVTNAYAGSIAWSNFFSRLTHSHPGRVVWLVFNVTIALMLMELGIFKMLEHALGLYSIVAVSWVSALVADLVINKPLGLSPRRHRVQARAPLRHQSGRRGRDVCRRRSRASRRFPASSARRCNRCRRSWRLPSPSSMAPLIAWATKAVSISPARRGKTGTASK